MATTALSTVNDNSRQRAITLPPWIRGDVKALYRCGATEMRNDSRDRAPLDTEDSLPAVEFVCGDCGRPVFWLPAVSGGPPYGVRWIVASARINTDCGIVTAMRLRGL